VSDTDLQAALVAKGEDAESFDQLVLDALRAIRGELDPQSDGARQAWHKIEQAQALLEAGVSE
jgi:hypothetical protein